MPAFYANHFVLPLPPGHRFPMRQYSMPGEAVTGIPGPAFRVAPRAGDDGVTPARKVSA